MYQYHVIFSSPCPTEHRVPLTEPTYTYLYMEGGMGAAGATRVWAAVLTGALAALVWGGMK